MNKPIELNSGFASTSRGLKVMPPTEAIEVDNLTKAYWIDNKRKEVVKDVCLKVGPGKILTLLGPNGSGKTTTLKMISGVVLPDSGRIAVLGCKPPFKNKASRYMGVLLEGNRTAYWNLNLIENLIYFGVLRGLKRKIARQRADELIEMFSLLEYRKTLVGNLSKGTQQKLALMLSFVNHPKILLLDEPTLGLDLQSINLLQSHITQLALGGCSVIITTHDMKFAEHVADQVVILSNGKVIANESAHKLIAKYQEGYYEIELERLEVMSQYPFVKVVDNVAMIPQEFLWEFLTGIKGESIKRVERKTSTLSEAFSHIIEREI
jgi:ABC-2 type transport system ATP-binding protein